MDGSWPLVSGLKEHLVVIDGEAADDSSRSMMKSMVDVSITAALFAVLVHIQKQARDGLR